MGSIEIWQAGDYNRAMSEVRKPFEPVYFSNIFNEVYEKKQANPNSPVGYELASRCVYAAVDLLKAQEENVAAEFVFQITHHPEDFAKLAELSRIKSSLKLVIDDFEVRRNYVNFGIAALVMAEDSVMADMKQGVFWSVVGIAALSMGTSKMN